LEGTHSAIQETYDEVILAKSKEPYGNHHC
jgi:hypothetical protein